MHGTVNGDRFEIGTLSSIAACTVAVIAGLVLYRLHVAQKWNAAFIGTLAPFWYLAAVFRLRWRHYSFWISFGICLAAHLLLLWLIFAVILGRTETVGIFVWIPAAMIESVPLYMSINALDRKFRSNREAP